MVTLDLHGEVCPFTFLRAKLALEALAFGDTLEILLDNEAAAKSVPRSLQTEGHEIAGMEKSASGFRLVVVKRREHPLQGRPEVGVDSRFAILTTADSQQSRVKSREESQNRVDHGVNSLLKRGLE